MKKIVQCIPKNIPLGSVIKDDVYTATGALFMKGNTVVNESVYKLMQRYMGSVYVEVEYEEASHQIQTSEAIYEDTSFTLDDDIKERARASMEFVYATDKVSDIEDASSSLADDISHRITSSEELSINLKNLKVSDDYTFKHCVDVATMSALLCRKLGARPEIISNITTSGLLHDLGKTNIPLEILNAPRELTREEFEIVKKHPVDGYEKIKKSRFFSEDVKMGVLQHHEKKDGSGYPLGLNGKNMHFFGKVLNVVDVYDALVTTRPYSLRKAPSVALEIMLGMFSQFDIDILRTFMDIVILYPIGTNVLGSDKKVYYVSGQNDGYPLRPIIKDYETGKEIDLLHDREYMSLTILSEV